MWPTPALGGWVALTMTVEDWDSLMAVNLTGVFLTVQACARRMVRQNQGGRIITIASLAAERPYPQLFAYCASKAGVRMMTRCWAQELAPFDITVNSIGPGIIDTPLGPESLATQTSGSNSSAVFLLVASVPRLILVIWPAGWPALRLHT